MAQIFLLVFLLAVSVSFAMHQAAADSGTASQLRQGIEAYYQGDVTAAVTILLPLARSGDVEARYILGDLMVSGRLGFFNEAGRILDGETVETMLGGAEQRRHIVRNAMDWLVEAAEANHRGALFAAAEALARQDPSDPRIDAFLVEASAQGAYRAATIRAMLLYYGTIEGPALIASNDSSPPEQAARLAEARLLPLVTEGYAHAAFFLAQIYESGLLPDRGDFALHEAFRQLAAAGSALGFRGMAALYSDPQSLLYHQEAAPVFGAVALLLAGEAPSRVMQDLEAGGEDMDLALAMLADVQLTLAQPGAPGEFCAGFLGAERNRCIGLTLFHHETCNYLDLEIAAPAFSQSQPYKNCRNQLLSN